MKPLPDRRVDDPGGFDWAALGLLVYDHLLFLAGVLAACLGARLLFTTTQPTFNPRERTVAWETVGIFRKTRRRYAFEQLALTLHPTVIPNIGGRVWRGYAVSLVSQDGRRLMLARSRDPGDLRPYAEPLAGILGTELRQTGQD